ncbi:MAG: glycoside hydrolase family 57 protein [Planctomycetota bacterium]
MTDVVLYFQVHQPYRLRGLRPRDRMRRLDYFDQPLNRMVVERVVDRCYLPGNRLLLEQIERTDGQLRCAFSLSGSVLRQLRQWSPEALDSFVALAETGCVEFLCETSHHSLSGVVCADEFREQVRLQQRAVTDLFGAPTTFRNTELILNNEICQLVEELGFDCVLGEGADRVLGGWRSPQVPYRPRGCERIRLLLRSYSLSDDIAFRFSDSQWDCHPLYADTYSDWLCDSSEPAQFIGLFMDYETFGEHQRAETGIFEFLRHLPEHVLEHDKLRFRTPAQVAAEFDAVQEIDFPDAVSWADAGRDLSAWLGNPMQRAAHERLYGLRERVLRAAEQRQELLHAWRELTTSDHVYYVATAQHSDASVHDYFRPHESPHAAFVAIMTAIDDLAAQVDRLLGAAPASAIGAGDDPTAAPISNETL